LTRAFIQRCSRPPNSNYFPPFIPIKSISHISHTNLILLVLLNLLACGAATAAASKRRATPTGGSASPPWGSWRLHISWLRCRSGGLACNGDSHNGGATRFYCRDHNTRRRRAGDRRDARGDDHECGGGARTGVERGEDCDSRRDHGAGGAGECRARYHRGQRRNGGRNDWERGERGSDEGAGGKVVGGRERDVRDPSDEGDAGGGERGGGELCGWERRGGGGDGRGRGSSRLALGEVVGNGIEDTLGDLGCSQIVTKAAVGVVVRKVAGVARGGGHGTATLGPGEGCLAVGVERPAGPLTAAAAENIELPVGCVCGGRRKYRVGCACVSTGERPAALAR